MGLDTVNKMLMLQDLRLDLRLSGTGDELCRSVLPREPYVIAISIIQYRTHASCVHTYYTLVRVYCQ